MENATRVALAGMMYVSAPAWPGGGYLYPVHLEDNFPVAAGTTTFYLNGYLSNTTIDSVSFWYGGMTATFSPN